MDSSMQDKEFGSLLITDCTGALEQSHKKKKKKKETK
jgi:hypothetical protein